MAEEFSYVILKPISGTGGILSRLASRTGLDFVRAHKITLGEESVERSAQRIDIPLTLPSTSGER